MDDIVIVSAGVYCWGTDHTELLQVLRQLGWQEQGENCWRAPVQSAEGDAMAAVRELYAAAPPVRGLDLEHCSEHMVAHPDADYGTGELDRFPQLRPAPELGRGIWIMQAGRSQPSD